MLYQDLEKIVNGTIELEDLNLPGIKIEYIKPEHYRVTTELSCDDNLDYMGVINWLKDYA